MRVAIVAGPGDTPVPMVQQLVAEGLGVRCLVAEPVPAEQIRAAGAEPVPLELATTTASRLTEAIGGVDAVVLSAGASRWASLVVDAAQLGGILPFVFASPGDPDAEAAARQSALDVTIVPHDPGAVRDALRDLMHSLASRPAIQDEGQR